MTTQSEVQNVRSEVEALLAKVDAAEKKAQNAIVPEDDMRQMMTALGGLHVELSDALEIRRTCADEYRRAKERMDFEVEPVLRAQCMDGKNAEERERKFRELAAADAEWQAANRETQGMKLALDAADDQVKVVEERSKALRVRANLTAALLTAMAE